MTLNLAELRRLEADIDLDHPGGVVMSHSEYRLHVAMRNALPELLNALEEAQALLRRVPSALNGAFMAGTEEREGGSARRQDKYAKEGDDLRREIPEFLRTLPPHGGVDVG